MYRFYCRVKEKDAEQAVITACKKLDKALGMDVSVYKNHEPQYKQTIFDIKLKSPRATLERLLFGETNITIRHSDNNEPALIFFFGLRTGAFKMDSVQEKIEKIADEMIQQINEKQKK